MNPSASARGSRDGRDLCALGPARSIPRQTRSPAFLRRDRRAFTLLEVMLAMALFFMAVFAILTLVSQNLSMARRMRQVDLGFSTLAAETGLTNRLDEGTTTGDLGELYPGVTWTRDIFLVSTGGLYQVDFLIEWTKDGVQQQQQSSILLFRPASSTAQGGMPSAARSALSR